MSDRLVGHLALVASTSGVGVLRYRAQTGQRLSVEKVIGILAHRETLGLAGWGTILILRCKSM